MLNMSKFEGLISIESDRFKMLAEMYVREALFFEKVVLKDLAALPRTARVVEIGAGIGLLSLLVGARGFEVIAFEPQSAGFEEMLRIRHCILESWEGPIPDVRFVNDYFSGDLPSDIEPADYCFSINVLEHVPDTENFLRIAAQAVKPGSQLRMIFPNYLFPYEPHFNIPTVFSKRLTFMLWRRSIASAEIPNAVAAWNDLSWPTLRKVRRSARTAGLKPTFTREAVLAYLVRIKADQHFLERKGVAGRFFFRPVAGLMHLVLPVVPRSLLPVMDVRFTRL